MSQSPWSTVSTSTPTSARMTRATSDRALPRSEPPYDAVLSTVAFTGARSEVAWRVERIALPSTLVSSSQSVPSERRRLPGGSVSYWSSPAMDMSSTEPTVINGIGPTSSVGAGPDSMPTRLERGVVVAGADEPVQPAHSLARPRVGVLELLHRREVRAVRRRQPGRVHRRDLAGVPQGQQGREVGVQAEEGVGDEELVLRDRDVGSRRVVRRIAVRHDEREAVGRSAQGEHDEHRGRGDDRGGRGGHDGRAHHRRGAAQREGTAQQAAATHRGELLAAGIAVGHVQGAGHGPGLPIGHRRHRR